MGFFKKLFKRKKGGTKFGNLLRGISNTASSGVLGTGSGLAAWEAKQEQKEMDAMIKREMEAKPAFQVGKSIGKLAKPSVDAALNSKEADDAKKFVLMAWLKKNWWKVLIPVVVIVVLIIVLFTRKGRNNGNRRTNKRR